MAKQTIDTATNNGTHIGDPAKTAFEKVNANFNELYPAALPASEPERAAARGRFGLGTAAVLASTTSSTDTTPGRVLTTGYAGWGVSTGVPDIIDSPPPSSGVWRYVNTAGGWPSVYGTMLSIGGGRGSGSLEWLADIAFPTEGSRALFRTKVNEAVYSEWSDLYHSAISAALPITGSLSPSVDNDVSYGTAARRPTQLFAATATIGTSDAREKTAVRTLTEAEYAVGLQLAREIGAYRWLEAVERKGPAAREHFGQTVQRAIEIFQQHGLDPFAYGAICYDTWEQETVEHPAQYEQVEIPAVLDEQGNEIEPARYEQGALIREAWTEVTLQAGDRYSWRDSELFWLMIAAQQRQADEQARQQEQILQRLAALERGA